MSAPSAAAEREPVVVRRRAARAVVAERPGTATRRFHESIPGYRPTPLRSAPQSARRAGVGTVIVKAESFRLGLPSFKILGASWAVCRAVADRLGLAPAQIPTFEALLSRAAELQPLALSAATDGNHGRAVAHMAARLGFAASIYVPRGTARARIRAIESEGAEVVVVDGGYGEAVTRSARDADERHLIISDTSWPGYDQVPRWISEGYATIFDEIEEQLAAGELPRPDIVVVPIGVGALAAAAVTYFWSAPPPRPLIVGVEPVSAACVLRSVAAGRVVTLPGSQDSIMAGLNCPTPSLTAWPLISEGIDVYLAIDDDRVPEAMRLLGSDGVEAGETGAAGLAGLLRLADAAPQAELPALSAASTALVICTEGATDPESYSRLTAAGAGRGVG